MKIKNVSVYGLESSIIASGYPMQVGEPEDLVERKPFVGVGIDETIVLTKQETSRGKKLAKAPVGSGHDNFLKGIIVQLDLQYPEYSSPQLQRYAWIDIVSSQSKMHRITSKELTREDFTHNTFQYIINDLNNEIRCYNSNNDTCSKEERFNRIISNLPSGYLKWMRITTNYLQLKTIYNQRKNHKLDEWRDFCNWIKTLPMAKELILNE